MTIMFKKIVRLGTVRRQTRAIRLVGSPELGDPQFSYMI